MWPIFVAIAIILILAALFIFLYTKNSKIEVPEGCEELRNEACRGCSIAESCKIK
ncbi:hypothetical protein LJC17_03410 [Acholeplasma sp. OttesenSCG-928-E16]|nr:hypothetical protein [Acholeplasma sp. OttesenSCG-928-E16]